MRRTFNICCTNVIANVAVIFLRLSTSGSSGLSVSPPTGEYYWDEGPELFSVAPMMGHTNLHYRVFYGQISKRAWLYSEMIPASRVVQSYVQATARLQVDGSPDRTNHNHQAALSLEEIPHHVECIRREYYSGLFKTYDPVLEELLHPGPNPAVLQLGGRDPEQLASAAAIATAFGFRAVNLNCGCPSASVSARATGAALMREPALVAQCLDAMSESMDRVNSSTILSVKHRLGVVDAKSYDAALDHAQDDQQAHRSCYDFVQRISYGSKLSRIQVHTRIALLGTDALPGTDGEEKKLWVPSSESLSSTTNQKINHQRVQYQAKRRARQVTLQNRSVPPLRSGVAEQIARDFPKLQVSSNGGIDCIEEVKNRMVGTQMGAMVGRAAINHPCSFAGVDTVVWNHEAASNLRTRRKVLLNYIDYCKEEEVRLEHIIGDVQRGQEIKRRKETESIAWHRRRLVAPIFHVLMGEEGNEAYQRRLRKLVARADRHSASSMLLAAMAEVPSHSLDKPLHEHTSWDQITKYDFTKRAGAMQRTIH
jgi:tRNA-dihydrouridine synthase A